MMRMIPFFIFSILMGFSSLGLANQCYEIFKGRTSMVKEFSEMGPNFERLPTEQRIEVLNTKISALQQQLAPTPRLWQRLFSEKVMTIHLRNKQIEAQIQKLTQWRDIYVSLAPMMEALPRRGFFFVEDELELLNRVVQSEKLYEAVLFLNQRFKDLADKNATEKHFLDAVIVYLTWGPDFSKDVTPVHHWIMFEILSGRTNHTLLRKMTKILFHSADMYAHEKKQARWQELTPEEARVEELWMIQQDPAYKLIEETDPALIESVINRAIDRHQLDYDSAVRTFRLQP